MKEEFCRIFASLESFEEVQALCRDLFTTSEIVMFVRRLRTARLLLAGQTYEEIMRGLGIGNSTVKAVAGKLSQRGEGFSAIQRRQEAIIGEIAEEVRLALEGMDPYGMEAIKQKYSMYYWPELLGRDAQKMIRHFTAARKRKKSLGKGP